MENAASKLAPVEHRVTFLGWDPTMKNEYRIRCQCGWTEKSKEHWRFTVQSQSVIRELYHTILMVRWERHVYTPEERLILAELEGSDFR